MKAAHFFFSTPPKYFSWIFRQLSSQFFSNVMSWKSRVQFSSVGFKNFIGFAEAICKIVEPAHYFEGTKTEFKRKGLKWMTLLATESLGVTNPW